MKKIFETTTQYVFNDQPLDHRGQQTAHEIGPTNITPLPPTSNWAYSIISWNGATCAPPKRLGIQGERKQLGCFAWN